VIGEPFAILFFRKKDLRLPPLFPAFSPAPACVSLQFPSKVDRSGLLNGCYRRQEHCGRGLARHSLSFFNDLRICVAPLPVFRQFFCLCHRRNRGGSPPSSSICNWVATHSSPVPYLEYFLLSSPPPPPITHFCPPALPISKKGAFVTWEAFLRSETSHWLVQQKRTEEVLFFLSLASQTNRGKTFAVLRSLDSV